MLGEDPLRIPMIASTRTDASRPPFRSIATSVTAPSGAQLINTLLWISVLISLMRFTRVSAVSHNHDEL